MVNIIAIGRIGVLGVGLGIGAALAATPGIAAADPTPDYGAIDASVLQDALPAAPTNIAISIDGFNLLESGTASATSGQGDFAIAFGADSNATATDGFGNYASASGTDANATATDGNFDVAMANSVFSTTGGTATAENGNFDVAQEGGLNGDATAGNGSFDSAYALTGASGSASAEFGSGDSATDIGDGVANAGGNTSFTGNADIADNFGVLNFSATAGSSDTAAGSFDLAAIFSGATQDAVATGANFLVCIVPGLCM